VVTLRTAGQPDRKLQILKTERLPDGKILTEVRDLATGQVFTIADTKVLGSPEPGQPALPKVAPAAASVTLPAQPPQYLPGTNVTQSNLLPLAKPRQSDPLLGQALSTMPATSNTPAPQQQYPTLIGKLRENKATTTTTDTTTPQSQSAMSRALFGNYSDPPQQQSTLVGRITEPSPAKPATTTVASSGGLRAAVFGTPTNQPAETPTLMGKLFGDKPDGTPMPVPATTPPTQVVRPPSTGIIRPNAAATNGPARVAVSMPIIEQQVAIAPMAAPVMPKSVIQQAEAISLTPISTDPRDPNFTVVPPKPMTMKQIEDMVKDLRMHHKPSSRLEAANSLANCPMAGMVEVRQILAEASYRDPIPVVRAHCIDLLTKMNYDEPNYRKYVESLVNDEEPAVQRAARNAVK
jgi:hypothetical protein